MVEQGIVAEVKGEKLIVNIERNPACVSCKACSMGEGKKMEIEFDNTIGAKKGDRVKIALDDSIILKGSFLFYVVPLLGLIIGLFIGKVFAEKIDLPMPAEVTSTLFGIIVMIMSFIIVRNYNAGNKDKYRSRITKA